MAIMTRLGAIAVAALVTAGAARAENTSPIVIELYTSQGCSSCPPADAFLRQLAGRRDVLPLALHVDYWDYIGWDDSFAQPRFTRRQQAYARAFHERMIYTPQMIVGGLHASVGTKPMELMDLVALHESAREDVDLTLDRQGTDLTVRAEAGEGVEPGFLVQLVRFRPEAEVEITRGENAGLTLDYANIVTDWSAVAEWTGERAVVAVGQARGAGPGGGDPAAAGAGQDRRGRGGRIGHFQRRWTQNHWPIWARIVASKRAVTAVIISIGVPRGTGASSRASNDSPSGRRMPWAGISSASWRSAISAGDRVVSAGRPKNGIGAPPRHMLVGGEKDRPALAQQAHHPRQAGPAAGKDRGRDRLERAAPMRLEQRVVHRPVEPADRDAAGGERGAHRVVVAEMRDDEDRRPPLVPRREQRRQAGAAQRVGRGDARQEFAAGIDLGHGPAEIVEAGDRDGAPLGR